MPCKARHTVERSDEAINRVTVNSLGEVVEYRAQSPRRNLDSVDQCLMAVDCHIGVVCSDDNLDCTATTTTTPTIRHRLTAMNTFNSQKMQKQKEKEENIDRWTDTYTTL